MNTEPTSRAICGLEWMDRVFNYSPGDNPYHVPDTRSQDHSSRIKGEKSMTSSNPNSASEFLGDQRSSRLTANTKAERRETGVLPSSCSPTTSAGLSLSPSFPPPSGGYHFFTPTYPRSRVVPAATSDAASFSSTSPVTPAPLLSADAAKGGRRCCGRGPHARSHQCGLPLSSLSHSTSPAGFTGSDERSHCLLTAGDGELFSLGRGTFGRLGTGREDDEVVPTARGSALRHREVTAYVRHRRRRRRSLPHRSLLVDTSSFT
jgi:hypothetical protein